MWLSIPQDTDFSIHNIPFGIASIPGGKPFACSRIGDYVINLNDLAATGFFENSITDPKVFDEPFLNDFIRLGKTVTNGVRKLLQDNLSADDSPLKNLPKVFIPAAHVVMHLPIEIGDYTDFYSSMEHATNVGKMFRDPENAL